MEKLLRWFKQMIKIVRMGTVADGISIKFNLQDEDGNYIRAHHDELLMPYWKECALALRHWSAYADEKTLKVFIRFIETPKAVLDMLRPAFEQSRIDTIIFEDNGHPGDTSLLVR